MSHHMSHFEVLDGYLCVSDTSRYNFMFGFRRMLTDLRKRSGAMDKRPKPHIQKCQILRTWRCSVGTPVGRVLGWGSTPDMAYRAMAMNCLEKRKYLSCVFPDGNK